MNTKTKRLLLNFLMEMLIYGLLLLIFFLAVLRLLIKPLNRLFHLNLSRPKVQLEPFEPMVS
jgi:hypothetical protein